MNIRYNIFTNRLLAVAIVLRRFILPPAEVNKLLKQRHSFNI